MRIATAVLLAIVATALVPSPSHPAVRYSYVGLCDGEICLIGVHGRTKLTLARGTEQADWEGIAVSLRSGKIVSSLVPDAGYYRAKLYEIDPRTHERRAVPNGVGYHVPECPAWLNDDVLLLDKIDKDGLDRGVYALNIRTGAAKLVVPPRPDNEFFYDPFPLSPSGRYVLTSFSVTGGTWLSVSDAVLGKRLWRTNPDEGMTGFPTAAWSADEKWLYAGFSIDGELASSSPGGVWRFDVRTGKQYPWKYAGHSIDGVFSVPRSNVVIVDRKTIDCLRMSDGRLLASLHATQVGRVLGAFGLPNGRWLLCGSQMIVKMDSRARRLRAWPVRGLASSTVRFSPSRNAIMFGGASRDGAYNNKAGVLDINTGRVTRFAAYVGQVEWLPRDVVR